MIITYNGLQSFKVQFGSTTLALNPVSKQSKSGKPARFASDITLISLNHPDFNGSEQNTYGDKEPFVISGPGEYEVQGVFITGFPSISHYQSKENVLNTIYFIKLEGVNLCFLGALDETEIKGDAKEALDEVDILFVPISGEGVLDAAGASKLSASLEPKIIIPMQYDKAMIAKFLKESGEKNGGPIDKLTIKKKDVLGKEGDVVVLKESV